MKHPDGLDRPRRVFWSLVLTMTVAATWLWDQASGEAIAAGRLVPAINALAGVLAVGSGLLLARMVWRLSGRGGKESV